MPDQAAVPMLVLTRHEDHVAAVNSALRDAGLPVHCTWLPDASDLADGLVQINPELLLYFVDEGLADPAAVVAVRDQQAPHVPVVFVHERIDENVLTAGLKVGAQDGVTLAGRVRMQHVCERELKAFRLQRALNSTVSSARESQRQLQALVAGSADAIAHVQEGIVVEANPAWLELFGVAEAEAIVGQPLMDLFDPSSHAALKGALVASLQGRWDAPILKASAALADGSTVGLELQLQTTDYDGEPAIRLCVPAQRQDTQEMEERIQQAVETDPSTGFLHRRYFVEHLAARIAASPPGGVRYLAYIRPDAFGTAVAQVGPLAAEDLVAAFGAVVRDELQPGDFCGRIGGTGFMVLLERGTPRDVEAWAENLVSRISHHVFRLGERTLSLTATAGIGPVHPSMKDASGPAADAVEANRAGREMGGNRVHTVDRSDTDTRVHAYDKIWVRHIKAALMENRFRLVQQPVASLLGEDKGMFDVLVRMLDEQGKEVLPSEFIPAAERNDLMKNIDRWVIGASMSFCALRKPTGVFVRVSRDTVCDPSLPTWLAHQLRASKVEPRLICFQVAEDVAGQYLIATKTFVDEVHRLGFRFALEHFGCTPGATQVLSHVGADFVKIDGTLMQGLSSNMGQQERVQELVLAARQAKAVTIAERVEDANTMAVLWQLGIEFIQGYLLHKPEEVVLG